MDRHTKQKHALLRLRDASTNTDPVMITDIPDVTTTPTSETSNNQDLPFMTELDQLLDLYNPLLSNQQQHTNDQTTTPNWINDLASLPDIPSTDEILSSAGDNPYNHIDHLTWLDIPSIDDLINNLPNML